MFRPRIPDAMRPLLLLLPALALACAPTARMAPAAAGGEVRPASLLATPLNDAERAVQEIVAADGVHVVHFWAPWCDNSVHELQQGWYEIVENNPDVSFAFVTIWNDGAAGEETLRRYAIPERARVLTQPDGREESARRREFLGMPVTWIPTTWVFRENGELAFAFNYGELTMPELQAALDSARREW